MSEGRAARDMVTITPTLTVDIATITIITIMTMAMDMDIVTVMITIMITIMTTNRLSRPIVPSTVTMRTMASASSRRGRSTNHLRR